MNPKSLFSVLPILAVLVLAAAPWGCGDKTATSPAPVTILVTPTPVPNPNRGVAWFSATSAAAFSGRVNFGSVVYENRMWVMGGFGGSTYFNDVWYSSNGTDWTRALADNGSPGSNQFNRRTDIGSVVYNNRMWVIGGYGDDFLNDVWSSPDGVVWTSVLNGNSSPGPNQFTGREYPRCLVFNNKMWVIGGNAGVYLNDVWSSTDGVSWTPVLAENPSPGSSQFSGRDIFCAVVFNNKMWVIGGYNGGYFNDVWSSTDGATWTNVLADTASPGPTQFSPRYGASLVVYNNLMWLIGGYGGISYNDVWYSSDGATWTKATGNAAFPTRTNFASLVFNNEMWVLGGSNTSYLNDVWESP